MSEAAQVLSGKLPSSIAIAQLNLTTVCTVGDERKRAAEQTLLFALLNHSTAPSAFD
jgi:hypothetical protein